MLRIASTSIPNQNHTRITITTRYCHIALPRGWARHGILLYPADGVTTDDTVRVKNTSIVIEQMTINLALPLASFRKECGQIDERILSVATTAVSQVARTLSGRISGNAQAHLRLNFLSLGSLKDHWIDLWG